MTVAVSSGYAQPYIEGNPVMLTCIVTGDNPSASIQWQKDGTDISMATTSPLTISTADDSGSYACLASNDVSSNVASNVETVTICRKYYTTLYLCTSYTTLSLLPGPVVSVAGNQSPYLAGNPVALSCGVNTCSGTVTYKWSKDGVFLNGETTSDIGFNYALSEAGAYRCLATLSDQEFRSDPATVIYERCKH